MTTDRGPTEGSALTADHIAGPGRPDVLAGLSRWALFAVVASAYACGAGLALLLLEWSGLAAVLFVPAGITVGVMLRIPRGSWWVVVLAAGLAEVTMDALFGFAPRAIAGFVVANLAEPLVGASIVARMCGRLDLARRRHTIWFVVGAVLAGPMIGAMVGSAASSLSEGDPLWSTFWQWWFGDAVGVVLVGGAVVAWGSSPDRRRLISWPGAGLMLGSAAMTAAIYGFSDLDLGFLVMLGVVVAGALFGSRAVAVTGLVVAATVAAMRVVDTGPLINGVSDGTALLLLKAQLGVFGAAGLLVAAEVSEREEATREASRLHARAAVYEVERREREKSRLLAEHALRSEERYQSLVDQTADGIFISDSAGQLVEVSAACAAMLGYQMQELVGLNVQDVLAPGQAGRLIRAATPLPEGDVVRHEWVLRRRDGSTFEGEVTLRLLPAGAFQGIVHDVSARNQIWDALRESEARLHTLFTSIDQGYCLAELIFDDLGHPVDYRFLATNPLFESMTGLSDAEGRTALELVPDLESHWVETYAKVALEGAAMRFESRSDAMGRWFDVFATPVEPRGRFALVFIDITARRTVELVLRESEERFRNMADHAPVMMWVTDTNGACTYLNERWYEFTGQAPESALGVGWLDATHPEDRERTHQLFASSNETQQPIRLEYRLRRGDGEYRWVIDTAVPRRGSEGVFLGYVGSVIEIHDRIEAEQKERKARGRFELLMGIMTELESVTGLADRAQRLVDMLVPPTADYATLELPGLDEPVLAFAHRDSDLAETFDEFPLGSHIPDESVFSASRAANGEGLLIPETTPEFHRSFRLRDAAARLGHSTPGSRLVVPLDLGDGVKAGLTLGISDPERPPYTDDDLLFLRDVADRAGLLLANARLMEHQHSVALRLQRALLPDALVRHRNVTLAARYEAASDGLEVGGDWYESFLMSGNRVGMAVGDVVGHGLDAAAAMGRLRAAMGAVAPHSRGPGALLSELDQFAVASASTDFATACCAVLDPATGVLHYASAGHPPILVVAPTGETQWLEEGRSPPLGTLADGRRPEASVVVAPGSVIVLYSDGLVERRREPLEVGQHRLERIVKRLRDDPVADICDRLVAEMGAGIAYEDDVVVVCVRVDSIAGGRFHRRVPARPAELAGLRAEVRDWLDSSGIRGPEGADLVLALDEACSNAIEHAYRSRVQGDIEVELVDDGEGSVSARVTDQGRWRQRDPSDDLRGKGLEIIERIGSAFAFDTGPDGTVVTFTVAITAPRP